MTTTRAFTLTTSLLFAALAATVPAAAGEVYGKVADGSTSVGDAATVAARCDAKTYAPAMTDKAGSYHLAVAESGKCTLTIAYKGQSADLQIATYDDPVQVDIVLEAKDGKLSARRK